MHSKIKRTAWNKGIKGSSKGNTSSRTESQKEFLRKLRTGKKMPLGFGEKISRYMRDHPNSGQFKKGHVPKNTGIRSGKYWITRWHPEYKEAVVVKPSSCDVCGIPEHLLKRKLSFDHNHTTGKFRGWLCGNCNTALGKTYDNPELLKKLAKYLEKNNEKR